MFGKKKDDKDTVVPISATAYTLSSLSEVLGFDVIEFWTPSESGELYCFDYFHAASIKQVIKKIYSDSSSFDPNILPSWSQNSKRVCFLHIFNINM